MMHNSPVCGSEKSSCPTTKTRRRAVVGAKVVGLSCLALAIGLFLTYWVSSVTPKQLDYPRMVGLHLEAVRVSTLQGGGAAGEINDLVRECELSGSVPVGDPYVEIVWDTRPGTGVLVLDGMLEGIGRLGYQQYKDFPYISGANAPIYYFRRKGGQFGMMIGIWDEPPNDVVIARITLRESPC